MRAFSREADFVMGSSAASMGVSEHHFGGCRHYSGYEPFYLMFRFAIWDRVIWEKFCYIEA